jgi:hypothetical protein
MKRLPSHPLTRFYSLLFTEKVGMIPTARALRANLRYSHDWIAHLH